MPNTMAQMRALKAHFDDELRGYGLDPDRPCALVIENGAQTLVLFPTGTKTLDLADLRKLSTALGAPEIDIFDRVVLGETWDGKVIDAWIDDDGLANPDRTPTMQTANGHTLCGPVVVTSCNASGDTVPLSLSDAFSLSCSGALMMRIPRIDGVKLNKPEPGFEVTGFDGPPDRVDPSQN